MGIGVEGKAYVREGGKELILYESIGKKSNSKTTNWWNKTIKGNRIGIKENWKWKF